MNSSNPRSESHKDDENIDLEQAFGGGWGAVATGFGAIMDGYSAYNAIKDGNEFEHEAETSRKEITSLNLETDDILKANESYKNLLNERERNS